MPKLFFEPLASAMAITDKPAAFPCSMAARMVGISRLNTSEGEQKTTAGYQRGVHQKNQGENKHKGIKWYI